MKKILKILLVEDNEGDVVLTKEAFGNTEIEHTIEVAKTGIEGHYPDKCVNFKL